MNNHGDEESLAQYFVTGLVATLANTDLDWLSVLVRIKQLVDLEIDKALDSWAEELMNDEDGVDDE